MQASNPANSLVYTDSYYWTQYTLTATSFTNISGVDGGTAKVDQLTVSGTGTLTSSGMINVDTTCTFTLKAPGTVSGTNYDFTMTFACQQFVSGTKVRPLCRSTLVLVHSRCPVTA